MQICQRALFDLTEGEPLMRIIRNRQLAHMPHGGFTGKVKITLFHVIQFPPTLLRCHQHGEAGVFFVVDAVDRVHHDAESDLHGCVSLKTIRSSSRPEWRAS